MHIPDGYLGPQTYGVMYGAMVPLWALASRIVRRTLRQRQVPFLAPRGMRLAGCSWPFSSAPGRR
jgi:ABC-type Co2+ transport system permease subunit